MLLFLFTFIPLIYVFSHFMWKDKDLFDYTALKKAGWAVVWFVVSYIAFNVFFGRMMKEYTVFSLISYYFIHDFFIHALFASIGFVLFHFRKTVFEQEVSYRDMYVWMTVFFAVLCINDFLFYYDRWTSFELFFRPALRFVMVVVLSWSGRTVMENTGSPLVVFGPAVVIIAMLSGSVSSMLFSYNLHIVSFFLTAIMTGLAVYVHVKIMDEEPSAMRPEDPDARKVTAD